jgi:hypothetical protein
MSDIGLIMNGLLGLLLVGALVVGWRLEARLKALRASHKGFVQAVEDLDRAAGRAEQGLADLRAATDSASETLTARIERAGHLATRLETLTAQALEAEARAAAAPRPQPAAAPPLRTPAQDREGLLARFSERYAAARQAPARPTPPSEALARRDLILDDEEDAPPSSDRATVARLDRLRALARSSRLAPPPTRPEPPLFDTPRRAAAGLR